MIRISNRLEGLLLVIFGAAMGWFACFGNYLYLMNARFIYLTIAGSALVILMGMTALRAPRGRPDAYGIAAFVLLALIVVIARPYAYDVNSLTLPKEFGSEGVPLVIEGTRYTYVGADELNRSLIPGKEEYTEKRIVLTGLYKRTPDLDAIDRFAVLRPFSVCCAADAFMIGIVAEGKGDTTLAEQWVNVYGTVARLEQPLPKLRIRHGAIRYAVAPDEYLLAVDSVASYIRPRPRKDVMDKLAEGSYEVFVRLAEAAGLPDMLEEFEMVTVLAPVNAAFNALPAGFVDELLEKGNRERLRAFVGTHVLVGLLMESDLRGLSSAETITGGSVRIHKVDASLRAGDSRFLFKNIEASNGVIHAIYPVLQPE